MIDFKEIAGEIFRVLRSFDYEVNAYDDDGQRVYEPEDARRFFAKPANLLISINDENENSSVRLYIGKNIEPKKILGLIQTLRTTCVKFAMIFTIRRWDRAIAPKEFSTSFSVTETKEPMKKLSESIYGSSTRSFVILNHTRVVFEHSKPSASDRTKNIKSIVMESNSETIPYSGSFYGALALARHLDMGGSASDKVGSKIAVMEGQLRTNPYNFQKIAILESFDRLSNPASYALEAVVLEESDVKVSKADHVKGLKSWVKDFKDASKNGNKKLASEIKSNIDKAIKDNELVSKEIYDLDESVLPLHNGPKRFTGAVEAFDIWMEGLTVENALVGIVEPITDYGYSDDEIAHVVEAFTVEDFISSPEMSAIKPRGAGGRFVPRYSLVGVLEEYLEEFVDTKFAYYFNEDQMTKLIDMIIPKIQHDLNKNGIILGEGEYTKEDVVVPASEKKITKKDLMDHEEDEEPELYGKDSPKETQDKLDDIERVKTLAGLR